MSTPDLNQFIEDLQEEIFQRQMELIDLKRVKDPSYKEKEELLENLTVEFDRMIKTYKSYQAYKKASGSKKTGDVDFSAMMKLINDIKANVGSIVQDIPKN